MDYIRLRLAEVKSHAALFDIDVELALENRGLHIHGGWSDAEYAYVSGRLVAEVVRLDAELDHRLAGDQPKLIKDAIRSGVRPGRLVKAISLWQPWASLLAHGIKTVETRSWPTAVRGVVVIHASKRWSPAERAVTREFAMRIHRNPVRRWDGLITRQMPNVPCGGYVGYGLLQECIPISDAAARFPDQVQYGDFSPGRFAWVFERLRPFPEIIPAVGYRMFWDVDESVLGISEGQE